jgi:toxin HigB-1
LELSFHDKDIRHICENNSFAIRKYGESIANKLKGRLADMITVDCPLDLPAGNLLIFKNGEDYLCKLELSEGYILLFCPIQNKVPLDEVGEIDWYKVNRIKILQILCNHE